MSHVATVTIDNTKVSADATDFPVYIDLSDLPSSFWDVVADGGGDIRAYKSDDTTELAVDIVTCVQASDTGEIHVQFTGTLSGSVDTVIHIYADGVSSAPAADATYGSEAVWDDYLIVSHEGGIADATGNNNLTNSGITSTTGKVGTAGDLDGSSDLSNIAVAVAATDDLVTFQGWAQTTKTTQTQLFREVSGGGLQRCATQYNRTSDGNIRLFWRDIDGNLIDAIETVPSEDWNDGSWYMHHHTISASTNTWGLYLNADSQSVAYTTQTTPDNMGNSGAYNDIGEVWDGKIDEFRLRNSLLASTWITTEYNNQNSPATFYAATAAGGGSTSIKEVNGLAIASAQGYNGLAKASIKTINGLSNV